MPDLLPVIRPGGSDSAALDNVLELVVHSGRDLLHAMMMLVPEAWENVAEMPEDLRAFYEFHAGLAEPWDGPAALAFSDGRVAAAALDRNGLRPARYTIADDGLVIVASEVGIVPLDPARIVEKGRLGPGRMIAVDTAAGRILTNETIKRERARTRPYAAWLAAGRIRPEGAATAPGVPDAAGDDAPVRRRLAAFGYSQEELQRILAPMWKDGVEPVWSMGDDTPLAVLSSRPRLLYTYVRQRFAQVTNPPIDSLRERLVMSLRTLLGARPNVLDEGPEHARLIELGSPLLSNPELADLRVLPGFRARALSVVFPAAEGGEGLERRLIGLCDEAVYHVEEGTVLLMLSDRAVDRGRRPSRCSWPWGRCTRNSSAGACGCG